jgi:DNA-binding response OmpR family regulator
MRVLFMHSREKPELARTLARDGHDVLAVADDEHAARLMRVFKPEMIVVAARDTVLACRDLRSQACEVPIIAIVASDDAEERVAALNAGADDCLGRPFHRAELIAGMRAAERRRLLIAARPHMVEQPAVGGEG